MGSVKDLTVIEEPTETKLGRGIFDFSDRYSVFDWGEMPDHIPYKGAALCMMAAWNFERLEELGIPTHYIGVLNNGYVVKTTQLDKPSNRMVIKLSRVIKPSFIDGRYSYDFFISGRGKINNFVVPLEVIYRRGVPEGSSLLKLFNQLEKSGDMDGLTSLLSKYGLKEKPKPGDEFPKIGYDFTTKFESSDRRLTDEEAYLISGLSEHHFTGLEDVRNYVSSFVASRAKKVGLVDFDGKHEYIFSDGVMLADVVGTLDEDRFMINGEQVSKEILRQVYKRFNSGWYNALEEAKAKARENGIDNWKYLVSVRPNPLGPNLVKLVGEMYAAGADRYTDLNLFKKRPLENIMEDLRPYTK